jgi:hypothetical protein
MRMIGRALLSALLLLSVPALADDVSNGSWSTTDASNNAAPPNGWPAGMFPNQVEPSARSNMGGVKRWWERANAGLSTTGSAGAYILTPSNTSYPTAYTQGEVTCAKANFTSVGNDTLNINGLGAKPVYFSTGAAFSKIGASRFYIGQQFCASYDSALNSGGGGFQLLTEGGTGPLTPTTIVASGSITGVGFNDTSVAGYSATAFGITNNFSFRGFQNDDYVDIVATSGGVRLAQGGGAWSSISDERLKNWSIPQVDLRDGIKKLWVGNFNRYQNMQKTGKGVSGFGVRAQQVLRVFPWLQGIAVWKPEKSNKSDVFHASSEPFAFMALWGVQDAYRQIDELKARDEKLEQQVRRLTAVVAALHREDRKSP